jgi:diguanylate cyclase (GGDEF)-like protein
MKVFEDKVNVKMETLISMIKKLSGDARGEQIAKTGATATIGELAFKAAAILCGIGLIFSVTAAMLITRNISGNIKKLKIATEMISKGNFDYRPDIKNTDELQDLSNAFITMSDRLRNLEEKSLDTSPLTRLPGGVTIEEVLDKRIKTHTSFAFCLMDIDNFKAFNDQYGYAKGNQLIKSTAKIIQKTVSEFGTEEDFVGHIGGDDFVLISTPERCGKICDEVITDFDKNVSNFYNTEDNTRGYIVRENRQGIRTFFPLASISIAVVTDNEKKMDNFIKVGEIAAELKEYAKSKTGSVCVFDKRAGDQDTNSLENVIEFPKCNGDFQESNIC